MRRGLPAGCVARILDIDDRCCGAQHGEPAEHSERVEHDGDHPGHDHDETLSRASATPTQPVEGAAGVAAPAHRQPGSRERPPSKLAERGETHWTE